MYVCIYVCIYIYIHRERERERETCIYIYIYIYICNNIMYIVLIASLLCRLSSVCPSPPLTASLSSPSPLPLLSPSVPFSPYGRCDVSVVRSRKPFCPLSLFLSLPLFLSRVPLPLPHSIQTESVLFILGASAIRTSSRSSSGNLGNLRRQALKNRSSRTAIHRQRNVPTPRASGSCTHESFAIDGYGNFVAAI